VAAQLVRPDRTNPPIDERRTLHAHAETAGLADLLDRSCGDCHSNLIVWHWYTRVAPVSWLMAYGVTKGRKAVNFSEWSTYAADERRNLLTMSCDDARSGKMPGAYTLLRPETRLSSKDVAAICAAAHADVRAGGVAP
jgi:hypothetical protein